jgi:sugar/nucleoside kinase (ribokinase family)
VLAVCQQYPQLDEKRPIEELCEQGGGQAATAAACVARLGGKVAFIGRVGSDAYGAKIIKSFTEAGVDISWGLEVVEGARSQFAFCVAEKGTGRRAIFWQPPDIEPLDPQRIDRRRATDTRAVLIDGHHVQAGIALATWCAEAGIPVVADLERAHEGLEELFAIVSFPILPEDFALAWSGADDCDSAANFLTKKTRGTLVITRGVQGSVAYTDHGRYHQPAFEIEAVVDTTGAGDTYHGAFAYAIAQGQTLKEAMRFASATAALSCTALGGRAGLPTAAEVAHLLRRGERLPRVH